MIKMHLLYYLVRVSSTAHQIVLTFVASIMECISRCTSFKSYTSSCKLFIRHLEWFNPPLTAINPRALDCNGQSKTKKIGLKAWLSIHFRLRLDIDGPTQELHRPRREHCWWNFLHILSFRAYWFLSRALLKQVNCKKRTASIFSNRLIQA